MLEQMGASAVALEGEKVSPNVDFFFSLALAEEGMNVGPVDEALHFSLDFQAVRISSFNSIRSASVVLKSSSELSFKAFLNTP